MGTGDSIGASYNSGIFLSSVRGEGREVMENIFGVDCLWHGATIGAEMELR